jgi:broad specificity phosphatase PhoE
MAEAMIRLYLVRHGHTAASRFGAARDPGLDADGFTQADVVAARLAPEGPLPIVVSPQRCARETAAALQRAWSRPARVEPAVSVIPSPEPDLAGRSAWLREILTGRWADMEPPLQAWRRAVLATLLALPESSVVVTHFVAINVAVGQATDDDQVRVFSPDHCSVTIVSVDPGGLRLVERGAEAPTPVL